MTGELGIPELRRICLAFPEAEETGGVGGRRRLRRTTVLRPPVRREQGGWIGAYLDVEQDWDELADLIEESYRLTAPKRVAALLDQPPAAT